MKTKNPYYFRFVVPCQYEKQFNTFKSAQRFAKKTGEKIYLTIYSKSNSFNEPYNERIITNELDLECLQTELINSVLTYINK